jgi:hypothetical protein
MLPRTTPERLSMLSDGVFAVLNRIRSGFTNR